MVEVLDVKRGSDPQSPAVALSSPRAPLMDHHGRSFEYLRLSLTDVCNFRCTYCLPAGYRRAQGAPPELSLAEIGRLVHGFARLGLWKIRLTGGEPTLRTDFVDIAALVAGIPGIKRLAMTTNGYRLVQNAARYRAAGIDAINISIDTLDPTQFHAITGHDRLAEVLAGVAACEAVGFDSVKINAVLLKGLNDGDLDRFIDYVAARNVTLRLIEVMRVNDQPGVFTQHHLSAAVVTDPLMQRGWQPVPRQHGAGPAIEFSHPSSIGRIGIIAPYADGFCSTCNRLRVSSTGKLHLCLFGDGGYDLRPLLQHDHQQADLVARIGALMGYKNAGHDLRQGNSGATPHLASIGG